jgi:hypothetical protein
MTGKKISAQAAIRNYCKGCIYDPADKGTWREQVEACTISHCELYEHRPVSLKTRKLQREQYLSTLSPEQLQRVEKRAEQARNRLNAHQ